MRIVKSIPKKCEGAAMVESCIVIILLCLILFGMLQLSIVTAAHDVNIYAASCGVRCAAVGYDNDMVEKSIRVAALSGMCLVRKNLRLSPLNSISKVSRSNCFSFFG